MPLDFSYLMDPPQGSTPAPPKKGGPVTFDDVPATPGGGGQPPPAESTAPGDYTPIFQEAGNKYNVDPLLLRAVADVESGEHHDRWAESPAGAMGVMQLMPDTAKSLGVTNPWDPHQNIHGGANYYRQMLERFHNDPYTAAMAYNAGPGGDFSNPAVREYADNVVGRWNDYRIAAMNKKSDGTSAAAPLSPPSRQTERQPSQPPLVLGDSLAVGIGGKGPGRVEGAGPKAVRDMVLATPPSEISGRDVVLSTGASNGIGDMSVIPQQVQYLKDHGARSVTIVGVGDRQDYQDNGVNDRLAGIAARLGVRFAGAIPSDQLSPDHVHPKEYSGLRAQTAPVADRDSPAVGRRQGPVTFDDIPIGGQQQPGGGGGIGHPQGPVTFDDIPMEPAVAPPAHTDAPTEHPGVQKPGEPPPSAEPDPKDPGWWETIKQGVLAPFHDIAQTVHVAQTGKPDATQAAPNIKAAQPITWGDLTNPNPSLAVKKMLYGLISSSPEMAGFFAGSAAGTAVTGGPETPAGWVGGLVGGAGGAALGHALRSFGPEFTAELKKTPNDPDGAFHRAFISTGIGSAVTGAGFGAFGWMPFTGAAVRSAEKVGADTVEGLAEARLKDLVFQAFGVQPGVAMGGQAVTNVAEGRPVGEGVAETYLPSVVGTMAPAIAHEGVRLISGRGGEAQPPAEGQPGGVFGPDTPEGRALAELERQARGLPPSGPTPLSPTLPAAPAAPGAEAPPPSPPPTREPPPATPPAAPAAPPPAREPPAAAPTRETREPPATIPEPKADIAAQIQEMHKPDSTRDAVFVPAGTEMPTDARHGVYSVERPEGTLLTTSPEKAQLFRNLPSVTDDAMAGILGHPESKSEVIDRAAKGEPASVVQAVDKQGNVSAETLATQGGTEAAARTVQSQAPDSDVRVVTPEAAAARRVNEVHSGDYVALDPEDLHIDPQRFQYKTSDERGVTGALSQEKTWEPLLANPITAWQDHDGVNWVVNGHQRTDLATRAKAAGQENVKVTARILRAADGYTPEFMRALGAYQNIAEGSGTMLDAARVLRAQGAMPDKFQLPDLPRGSPLARGAAGLAKLGDQAFGMVENGHVPEAYAAHVGDLIADTNEQVAAMGALARAEPANANQARLMVQDMKNAGFLTHVQEGLFGPEHQAQSLFGERAKILDAAMRQISGLKRTYKAAVEGEEALTATGNVLSREGNVAARTENERLLQTLARDATTKGPISDALTAFAREVASGGNIKSVAARFLAAVREIVRRGEGEGVQPGAPVGGARPAEEEPGLAFGAGRRPFVPGQGDLLGGAPREAPPRRGAEPTIRGDPRQQVMPGMEPSARQAQAARDQAGMRPAVEQKPADEGLFAKPEAKQPELPTQPAETSSKWRTPGGTDLTHTVPAHTPETANATAANWIFDRGQATETATHNGDEHIAVVDLVSGKIVHAATEGKDNEVSLNLAALEGQPDGSVIIHHNHPNNTALSGQDLKTMVKNPALGRVVAIGHDGSVTHAGPGPYLEGLTPQEAHGRLVQILNAVRSNLLGTFKSLIKDGKLGAAEANAKFHDAVNRVLHGLGVIDYVSTKEVPDAVAAQLRHVVEKTLGRPADDRLTATVRSDEAIASVPAPVVGQPGGEGAGVPAGTGVHPPSPEGPRQGSLLAGEAPGEVGRFAEDADERRFEEPPSALTPPLIRNAASGIRAAAGEVTQSIRQGLAPLSTGSMRAQAFATTFANGLRRVMYRYGVIDREIERTFSPAQREAMGRAMDAQSVFEKQVAERPPEEQAALRADFDRGETGLAGLEPKARATLEMLDQRDADLWSRMQQRGIVEPDAQRIPYWFARQILIKNPDGSFSLPPRTGGGAGRGLDQRGGNLTTKGILGREYATPEETEAAAKAKFGPDAVLLRDIRSMVQRMAEVERSIHGRDLIDAIDSVGRETGVNLVVRGDIPGLLTPGEFFTMADHPSFRDWNGSGWSAVHISKEFEGPLKAVLTQKSPAWYNAAMKAKGGVMSSIMFSPFIHLGVEIGRALPLMPGRILSLRALRDGSRLRKDAGYMDNAIRDGISPLGQGWHADPVSIADQAVGESRNRFVRAFQGVRDAVATGAGKIGGQWLHDVIQHPHQALLWDQVFNLQMGIYDAMRTRMMAKGVDELSAGAIAAHIANRYAGALPPEHLSKSANMAANLLLFSRSFTLGNLGVMKDMLTGAPAHVLARIEQMAGGEAAKTAQSALRRKAISAFTLDVGLYYMANALAQTGIQIYQNSGGPGGWSGAAKQAWDQWLSDAGEAVKESKDNPLAIFGVLPQHWNEPGKQNRVYAGNDSTGRGVYMRLPPGKVGEEFLGWFAHPGTMLENKLSPLVRPLAEAIVGSDTLGRKIYKPDPQSLGDYFRIAGAIVQHIGAGLLPMQTLQGAGELYQHYVEGKPSKEDPSVAAARVWGPMTGLFTVSSGFPGGPEAGEMHAASERHKADIQSALPEARQKIDAGDKEGAVEVMRQANMTQQEIRSYMRFLQRQPGPTKAQERKFGFYATPEERARVERDRLQGATP